MRNKFHQSFQHKYINLSSLEQYCSLCLTTTKKRKEDCFTLCMKIEMEKEKEGSKKKVMVAIDESEHSYHALMWALDNLKEFLTNSPLVIFAAQPNPDCFQRYGAQLGTTCMASPLPATPSFISSVLRKNEEQAMRLLEKAKSICADRGVKTESTTEAGEPKELICKVVQDYKINLLVVGSHPVGFLQRIFGGSLSDYCVNNAQCSVLVVKKPA